MPGNPRLAAALFYVSLGWPVFPLLPGSKQPHKGSHGHHDASTDPSLTTHWWTLHPDANIGIGTGTPGPDVLDVDADKGDGRSGYPAFRALREAGLLAGAIGMVATPSGGLHIYYRGSQQGNGNNMGGQRIDFRGRGGYVVAPGSVVGGKSYEPLPGWNLRDARQIDMTAVRTFLAPQRQQRNRSHDDGPVDLGDMARWQYRQPEGNRNGALFYVCARVLGSHGDDADLTVFEQIARRNGLSDQEIEVTVSSARRSGRRFTT